MDEVGRHSSLIGDIYDAALDPSRWASVAEKSAQFVAGFAVSVIVIDRRDQGANFDRHFGLDPYYEQLYEENYRKCDPRPALNSLFKVGEVFSTTAFDQAEYRNTRFYQEYMQPQGVSDNVMCVFERSPTSHAVFGLFRHEDNGPAETTFRRMRLLMPHMRRGLLIAKSMALSKAESATFTDTLDGLRTGVFFLDARQRIVHANKSGHAMLAKGRFLRMASGRLAANEPNAKKTLDRGIEMAAKGDPALGGSGLTVPLQTSDGDPYVAYLLPLTSGERRRAGTMYESVAALFIHRAVPEVSSSSEIMAIRYKLTPMELNVLFAIVEVGGVPEVAEELGIAQSTVKTHLLRVFAKTGTRRQADLVKLIVGFSRPLLS
jgi:DNA-binding CsgD family transcriptional regulator